MVLSAKAGSCGAVLLVLLLIFAPLGSAADGVRVGGCFDLGSAKAAVTKIETLPVIQNEYSARFRFDSAENPKLKQLRERYNLDAVIAPGTTEFDQQVLLMDWVHNRFRKFGQPASSARGALEILEGISEGQAFFCTQYAQLFASAAASLGWVDRVLALRRHQDLIPGRSSEHATTEIWSNQHRKWIMLDPTSNMYLEKDGVPLNAYEIRQEWFYRGGRDLTFVIGKERRRYRKADLPIFLRRFEGFGDLRVDPDELDKYGFIGYIPNTDLMDSGFDYGAMFIVKDQLCAGTQWHTRDLPANPAVDPYFPLGQAALRLRPEEGRLAVELETFTPNFERFEIRIGDGEWKETPAAFHWTPRAGSNRFQAHTVNAFGVCGPVTTLEMRLSH